MIKDESDTTEKDEFTFPFSTCETPNKTGIAQPYSFFLNIFSISIVFYFLCLTRKLYNFLLMLSLFAFEAVHTFSHFIHLPNSLQVNVIHPISYFMNIFYFLVLYKHTHVFPKPWFMLLLLILFTLDLYFFLFLPFIYSFTSFFAIFFAILIYYYRYLSNSDKSYITQIAVIGIVILGLFYNEKFNCAQMLSLSPGFPFHIILEVFGLVGFIVISRFFYDL
jgi:hypothetical protein